MRLFQQPAIELLMAGSHVANEAGFQLSASGSKKQIPIIGQFSDKKAVFQGKINSTFIGLAFDWKPMTRGRPLIMKVKELAERVGFEPTLPSRVNLISSQAPSAVLGHLSIFLPLSLP